MHSLNLPHPSSSAPALTHFPEHQAVFGFIFSRMTHVQGGLLQLEH